MLSQAFPGFHARVTSTRPSDTGAGSALTHFTHMSAVQACVVCESAGLEAKQPRPGLLMAEAVQSPGPQAEAASRRSLSLAELTPALVCSAGAGTRLTSLLAILGSV